MEGHFRFEVAEEESVQITAIDGSGTLHSQFTKDGTAKDFGICDAENVTFQMKGFSKPNLEVELPIKILHFNEDWKKKYVHEIKMFKVIFVIVRPFAWWFSPHVRWDNWPCTM